MVHVISSEFGMVKRSTIMAFSYNETKKTYILRDMGYLPVPNFQMEFLFKNVITLHSNDLKLGYKY